MHQLDSTSKEKLDKRAEVGEDILRLAWGNGARPVLEDRESAAADAISDVLTAMVGAAGVTVPLPEPGAPDVDRFEARMDTAARSRAEDLLDRAFRSWEGDREDYMTEPERTPEAIARHAFEVLTGYELSPSTVDLVTVEGIKAATWADAPGERFELLDVIVSKYEAQAVEANDARAISALVEVREAIREAVEEEQQPEPGEYGHEEPETGEALVDAIGRLQKMRDEAQAEIDENDKPGGWLDSGGSYKDWESEASAREVEATRDAYDRALDVLQTLAHGLAPAQGS